MQRCGAGLIPAFAFGQRGSVCEKAGGLPRAGAAAVYSGACHVFVPVGDKRPLYCKLSSHAGFVRGAGDAAGSRGGKTAPVWKTGRMKRSCLRACRLRWGAKGAGLFETGGIP